MVEHMDQISAGRYCTLYLARHGETEWNVQRRIQGQLDSALTPQGVVESQRQAVKLRDVALAAIFSSDLGRAQQTAAILKLERELAIITKEALRERTFGEFDGFMHAEYIAKIQHKLAEYEQLPDEVKWAYKFAPNYESDEELLGRFMAALREIAVGYLEQTVLVVTHGGNLRTFLTKVGGLPAGVLQPGTFKNAGYIKLRCDGVDFLIDEIEGVDPNLLR